MTREGQSGDRGVRFDEHSLNYWTEKFAGTPFSIVVPPYIRFLQGTLVLRKAQVLLQNVQLVALAGHELLSSLFEAVDQSKDTKQLGLTYETFFASQLTINLVSEVEHFFGSVVSAALRMYPEKMGAQTLTLREVISASSRDELLGRAANAVLNDLMYKRPNEYLKELASILSIEAGGLQKSWPAFVELKSRRDLGVHNNWIVNEIYLRKLREATISSSHSLGDRVVPDFKYLHQASDTCDQLVETMANLLADKWLKTPLDDVGV